MRALPRLTGRPIGRNSIGGLASFQREPSLAPLKYSIAAGMKADKAMRIASERPSAFKSPSSRRISPNLGSGDLCFEGRAVEAIGMSQEPAQIGRRGDH